MGATPKQLHVFDANVPPKARKFPFRLANSDPPEWVEDVRLRAHDALSGVEGMLLTAARRAQEYYPNLTASQLDDILNRARLHLWIKSLPLYDAKRFPPTKLETYLHVCISNIIRQLCRAEMSKKHKRIKFGEAHLAEAASQDTSLDRRIEALAGHIMEHPEELLTAAQVEVFREVMTKDEPLKALAKKLGYKRASSLSMMVRRIRDRIAGIDIEGWEPRVAA